MFRCCSHQPRLDGHETSAWTWCSGKTQRDRVEGMWKGGSGWGIHIYPWLIHVNVWQKPLQYCKVISLQLIKKRTQIEKKQKEMLCSPENYRNPCKGCRFFFCLHFQFVNTTADISNQSPLMQKPVLSALYLLSTIFLSFFFSPNSLLLILKSCYLLPKAA